MFFFVEYKKSYDILASHHPRSLFHLYNIVTCEINGIAMVPDQSYMADERLLFIQVTTILDKLPKIFES